MRYSLLLLPLAALGLAGCVGVNAISSPQASPNSMTVSQAATYMNAEELGHAGVVAG